MRGFLEHRIEVTAAGHLNPYWLGSYAQTQLDNVKALLDALSNHMCLLAGSYTAYEGSLPPGVS